MNKIIQKRIEEAVKKTACPQCVFNDGGTCNNDDDCKLFDDFVGLMTFILQNQWISVCEALPDDDENVLLIFDDGHIIVAYHSGNYWWWCDGFVCGTKTNGQPMYSSSQRIDDDDKPTHWMPITEIKGGEK